MRHYTSAMVQYTHTSSTQGNSLQQAFTHITTGRIQSFLHQMLSAAFQFCLYKLNAGS